MAGRHRTPTRLRELQGNRGKRPLPEAEPEPRLGIPDCPDRLGEHGTAEWDRLTAELDAIGLLTQADLALLAAYCSAWQQFLTACGDIEDRGQLIVTERGERRNPSLIVKGQAVQELLQLAPHFGLSPATRARMGAPKQEKKNPLAEFLGAKKSR